MGGLEDGRVNRCLKRFLSPTGTCASENTISVSYTDFIERFLLAEVRSLAKEPHPVTRLCFQQEVDYQHSLGLI